MTKSSGKLFLIGILNMLVFFIASGCQEPTHCECQKAYALEEKADTDFIKRCLKMDAKKIRRFRDEKNDDIKDEIYESFTADCP